MAKLIIREHEEKPLRWWYSKRDEIDFEPIYQRHSKIWPQGNKSYLIDSIINGYDIPRIYMADFRIGNSPLNKKNRIYAIIDGKQRLQTIFEFFEDGFRLGAKHPIVFEENSDTDLNGLTYSMLRASHPKLAAIVDDFVINVVGVWTDKEGPIESLFVRLNTSLPANGAERRNAIPGPVMDATRVISRHKLFDKYIRFNTIRAADRNAAIKLLWIEFNSDLKDTKKTDLDSFATMSPGAKLLAETLKKTDFTLNSMVRVFQEKDILLSSSGILPLYYWLVRSLPEKHYDKLRPFLMDFENKRKEAARKRKNDEVVSDHELQDFERSRRSPNDGSALRMMFSFLRKRFLQSV